MSSKTQGFVISAVQLHGDKYDYSQTKYTNYKTKVKIICHAHEEPFVFEMTPENHIHNIKGCPVCDRVSVEMFKRDTPRKERKSPKNPPRRYPKRDLRGIIDHANCVMWRQVFGSMVGESVDESIISEYATQYRKSCMAIRRNGESEGAST